MGDFLTVVRSVPSRPAPSQENAQIAQAASNKRMQPAPSISGPKDVLQILRSQPDEPLLVHVLRYLVSTTDGNDEFNIKIPGPISAQLINELVATTIPDYWACDENVRKLLLESLRSIAGVGAVITRLKQSSLQMQQYKQAMQTPDLSRSVADLISVLTQLLQGDHLAWSIWEGLKKASKRPMQSKLLWKEFLASIASGRSIATTAEAEDALAKTSIKREPSWVSNGSEYSAWMGRNVAYFAIKVGLNDEEGWGAISQFVGRALTIGYSAKLVETIHEALTLSAPDMIPRMHLLAAHLAGYQQRQFVDCTIKFMSSRLATTEKNSDDIRTLLETPVEVTGSATLLSGLIGHNHTLSEILSTWLSNPSGNATESFLVRRASIAVYAQDEETMQEVMEKHMQVFGEALFIKHAPILHQEAVAQILLMACGYVHRTQPMFLFTLARSSTYLNAVSNRLHSSSTRARFLGMVVGMAVSALVDRSEQKMRFDLDELKTPEALWYLHLTRVNDAVGSQDDMDLVFKQSTRLAVHPTARRTKQVEMEKRSKERRPAVAKADPGSSTSEISGPRIVEVLDESDEDEFTPYNKPDSDLEDEDEDATVVTRNKPRAPVYIRDLIAGLRDNESYDRHRLALMNAASLIRRKSQFGKEVSDHALELATILTGLGDAFEMEDFQTLRLQALVAVLLSNPSNMAGWFARQVFEGDYSMSQRATVLSVLGLGARELAGFKDEDDLNPSVASSEFPSKRLPDRLHNMYTSEQSPVSSISAKLERSLIQPMALRAADSVSGPNVLKVRTFSSRMEVEKNRKKATPNALAKIVAENFFFPLTGRWWQNMQAYGSHNVHFQPFLLSTYVKTLALLLHASGSSTLSLPQMTSEFWDLLLSVRTQAVSDVSVLEALLFALLTLLEVNEDKRRVAEEHSKQLVETQEWAELVFERNAGGDKEGERVRMLAASVLLKTRDVVEQFQRLLVGDMLDY